MTKSLRKLWDLLLFRDRGILPTKRFIISYFLLSLVLISLSFFDVSWTFILLTNGLLIGFSFLDLLFSPRQKELTFSREIEEKLERNIVYDVIIHVRNDSDKSFSFTLMDDLPDSFKGSFQMVETVSPKATEKFSYEIKPLVRGDYVFEKLSIRYTSFLRLWQKQMAVQDEAQVKVIPDLSEAKSYLTDAQRFLTYEGVHIKKQQVGMGEFASIRSYVVGDDPRMINWHQTAKLQEVMTNQYEPEQGKYVTILIDAGRMMGVELKTGNRLERSLEAAITVAAAALERGDYVSVIAFSKGVRIFIPPEKGMYQLQRIINEIYNLQVEPVESNYVEAFHYVETMVNKRSLLLLFSDIQTVLQNDYLIGQLSRLRRRHLFFVVGIDDGVLLKRANMRPESVSESMMKSVAQEQVLSKNRAKLFWEQRGLHFVEAEEERVTAVALSHYIDLMNRGLL
mgnify:CR=1 FL=1